MELPIYTVKEDKGKWQVVRPDKTVVNNVSHGTKGEAERQLNLLIAYNICKTGDTE